MEKRKYYPCSQEGESKFNKKNIDQSHVYQYLGKYLKSLFTVPCLNTYKIINFFLIINLVSVVVFLVFHNSICRTFCGSARTSIRCARTFLRSVPSLSKTVSSEEVRQKIEEKDNKVVSRVIRWNMATDEEIEELSEGLRSGDATDHYNITISDQQHADPAHEVDPTAQQVRTEK